MTPEGVVKKAVDISLKAAGAYWHKPVMNGMGAPALDYHVCHRGYYAGIETKAKGKLPTPRQIRTMREIIKAGGSIFLIDEVGGPDHQELIKWLINPNQTRSPLAKQK
jgi:hypothetical protein